MAQPSNTQQTASKKLNPVPFVMDVPHYQKPRAWRAKANAKNPKQITVELGTVSIRIAGSAVTFTVPAQLVFDSDSAAAPDGVLRVPFDGKPFGSAPLFGSDTDADASDLEKFWADTASKFWAWYKTQKHDGMVDLATIDGKTAAALIGTSAGTVKTAIR